MTMSSTEELVAIIKARHDAERVMKAVESAKEGLQQKLQALVDGVMEYVTEFYLQTPQTPPISNITIYVDVGFHGHVTKYARIVDGEVLGIWLRIHANTREIVEYIKELMKDSYIVIDDAGLGGLILDRLREDGYNPQNARAGSKQSFLSSDKRKQIHDYQ